MTTLHFTDTNLIITLEGADKLWALKSRLTIPLDHISEVSYSPETAGSWLSGLKVMGARIPGVIMAGTFYQDGDRVFWDVHHPEQAITIALRDEQYKALIIEVEDPQSAIAAITAALP